MKYEIGVGYDLIVAVDGGGDGYILYTNPEIAEWKVDWIDNEGNELVEQINLEVGIGVYAITMFWDGEDHESGNLEFEIAKILWDWGQEVSD